MIPYREEKYSLIVNALPGTWLFWLAKIKEIHNNRPTKLKRTLRWAAWGLFYNDNFKKISDVRIACWTLHVQNSLVYLQLAKIVSPFLFWFHKEGYVIISEIKCMTYQLPNFLFSWCTAWTAPRSESLLKEFLGKGWSRAIV